MEVKTVCFCMVVAVLGIISAAAGFAAEVKRVKAQDVSIEGYSCVYPSSPALALGIISAVFAIITQVFISVTFDACRCCKNDPTSTPIAKLLSILSRVATVIAVILLLAAARLSTKGGEVESYNYIKCYVVKPGIFAIGATLALLSAVFGIGAYVSVAPVPSPQEANNPAVAFPAGANIDPENNHVPISPQQYTHR